MSEWLENNVLVVKEGGVKRHRGLAEMVRLGGRAGSSKVRRTQHERDVSKEARQASCRSKIPGRRSCDWGPEST